jgi:hypothetical protein
MASATQIAASNYAQRAMTADTSDGGAKPYAHPIRANPFFTLLNRDIRYMIYDLLDLPPMSLSCLGFVLSCREALAEAEQVAALRLKQLLLSFESEVPTEWHEIVLPTFPPGTAYRDLNNIQIICSERALQDIGKAYRSLLSHYFAKISYVCSSIEGLEVSQSLPEPATMRIPSDESLPQGHLLTAAEPGTVHYEMANYVEKVLGVIEQEHQPTMQPSGRRRSKIEGPVQPIRTVTIEIVWGCLLPDAIISPEGFNYLDAQYLTQHKDELRRVGIQPRQYAWPTWAQLCRKDDSAGMISVTSRRRWVDGVDKQALIEGRTTEQTFQMWRNAYMS